MAASIGVGKNSVIFTLQLLEREGIIKRGSGIIMLNPETLNKQYDSIKNELLNTYSKDPQPLKADRECPLLSQKKSGGTLIEFKRKLDEKETLLNRREDKLNMKQAALEGREMKLRSWEDRIDNLLGIT